MVEHITWIIISHQLIQIQSFEDLLKYRFVNRQRGADVGLGIQSAANALGLDSIPVGGEK